ncbi:MAG: DUF2812 domain-containing protein [Clostridia bacterium]|nr:DUF2812 domain-containing protein [Clostridia bacterium]
MKNTKRRMFRFSLYDRTGIVEYLEDQAKSGWVIEKIDNFGFKFRKIEPKDLHFSVTYLPELSEFTPLPDDKQMKLFDFCEHTGWKSIESTLQLQVFYNENDDPVPIETDALIELENIHKAGKKSFLLTGYLFVIISVLQLLSAFLRPCDIYNVTFIILWSVLLIAHSTELIRYYYWRKKALKNAMTGGCFTPSKSNVWFKNILTVFLLLSLLMLFVSSAFEFGLPIVVFIILNVSVLFLAVSGVLHLSKAMRNDGVSEKTNKIITISLIIIVTVFTVSIISFIGILLQII